MPTHHHTRATLQINRAPVLTLWAAVVAERLGFTWDEVLTLGRAVAGLNAYTKGKALGLFTPTPPAVQAQRQAQRGPEPLYVALLHRVVPVAHTEAGLCALSKGKPMEPASVQRYLQQKFGDELDAAMPRCSRSPPRGRQLPWRPRRISSTNTSDRPCRPVPGAGAPRGRCTWRRFGSSR